MVLGKAIFIAGMIMQIIIRYPYRNSMKRKQTDPQEQILLLLITIGGLILPLIYIFTDWLAFADYPSSLWLIGIGTVVLAIGLWLFWRAHKDLGQNWSSTLEIHDTHTLITQGIYQRVRHPMYAAGWVMMIAQAFLLSNWIAGFGGVVTFGIMYFMRVSKEEQMMLQQFGDQYQQYMARTGRIIPKRASP